MVFSSHIFLFYFLPLSLACYYTLPLRARNLILTLLSYLFCGWSNPLFTLLMLLGTDLKNNRIRNHGVFMVAQQKTDWHRLLE